MAKTTRFLWGWQGYAPTADATMTRERMARLMRVWRRYIRCIARKAGSRTYSLGSRATFVIQTKGN